MAQLFSIGELARRTGVKVPTIRYYENMGLISSSARSEGNQRRFGQAELERLSFVRHARDLGFTLDNIRELVGLSHDENTPCDEVHQITSQHLISVREKIARLKRLERELKRIESLADGGTVGECRVIQALADHSLCAADHD